MRKLLAFIASLVLLAGASPSLAAPCRDAKGRFAKCPSTIRCRDAKGHFAKCGLPGTHPA